MLFRSNWHGLLQGEIISRLNDLLKSGRSSAEVSIQTTDGVRVADVAWTEKTFIQQYREQTPYQIAPAICVEIISPSNSKKEMQQKIDLYLEAGASEVWLCNLEGELKFYSQDGQLEQSGLAPEFPKRIEL